MTDPTKKTGTITLAQGIGLEAALTEFVRGLDVAEAQWMLDHFTDVERFIRRRPTAGLLSKGSSHIFKIQDFTPRGQTLEKAGLLKYVLREYQSGEERDEWFPGPYNGPPEFRCALQAYAIGNDAPYRADVMHNTPTGLPRIAIDLQARGFQLANLHQAASFAAEVSTHVSPENWVGQYGACRIYALGTQYARRHSESAIVPVLLSPGVKDETSDRKDRSMQWRLDYEHIDHNAYRRPDAWFLTVTPYNG